ncbi:hypothetical protein PsorP6_003164 [Peronosclerospora sorghi]|uniref:Uncharacterized protein n=1 Tax=Peronosclerospora sorghi TaxID=230839 RepID=A0ACC0VK81_9STRA|nr:hypothetical protein PsorP6_003164 [Peronosclerospora sorghi]
MKEGEYYVGFDRPDPEAIIRLTTSRPCLMAVQISTKGPVSSLNHAAVQANLDLSGTLEELAASHFSEASVFPEFSPIEDTLLSETLPRIETPEPIMDAHAMAEDLLTLEIQQHFCQPSDFPEYTPAEEEAILHRQM